MRRCNSDMSMLPMVYDVRNSAPCGRRRHVLAARIRLMARREILFMNLVDEFVDFLQPSSVY